MNTVVPASLAVLASPPAVAAWPASLAALLSPEFTPARGLLAELMRKRIPYCVFQPIGDLREGGIFGHEALIRGPTGSPLQSPDALFKLARQEALLPDFEIYCVFTALEQWGRLGEPGRLFINLSAEALVGLLHDATGMPRAVALAEGIRSLGVDPRMLIIEITEQEPVSDIGRLSDAVRLLHGAGAQLALDDFGDGRSSLRVWSEVKPEYVKIDKYFTRDIAARPENLQMVRAIKGIAELFGTQLIAEGIETADDLRVLRDLEIAFGQGYLLGHPQASPRTSMEAEAAAVLNDRRVAVMPQMQTVSRPHALRSLSIIKAPPATATTTNDEMAKLLQARPDLHAIPLLEGERPVALMNRQQFLNHYATLYFREVHGKKSCMAYANTNPRLVELDDDVDGLMTILTSQDQRYLSDGFIVTENGRYLGLGTGDQLVRSVTEARIEAARHANPLTFLPGNIPISLHVGRLLESGAEFVACYLDLNHFKPFNDHYGYWRGDEMIRLVAQIALSHCDTRRDFVGHVGGDDFLVLFQSYDWEERCRRMIDTFATQAYALFDEPARLAGGIEGEDRYGVPRFFPCTSLAIGALCVTSGQFRDAEAVANAAAMAKHDAKHASSGLAVRRGPHAGHGEDDGEASLRQEARGAAGPQR